MRARTGDARFTWAPRAWGYLPMMDLQTHLPTARRAWFLNGRLLSLEDATGGVWKDQARGFTPETADVLRRYAARGVRHPSSFGTVFHQGVYPNQSRVPATVNAVLRGWSLGPVEEAQAGIYYGTWYRYDIRQAYRWAATLGLPQVDRCRVVDRFTERWPGLWQVKVTDDGQRLPQAFYERPDEWTIMSSEDLAYYGPTVRAVGRGIVWDATHPPEFLETKLQGWPAVKHIGRSFWGLWGGQSRLVTRAGARTWELPNRWQNLPWAVLIVHRVRQRLAEYAGESVHTYVDEIVVPRPLPVPPVAGLGDWHLKDTYPDGVIVRRVGEFGRPGLAPAMQTGVPRKERAA